MRLFIGAVEEGFFVEEQAKKEDDTCSFIDPNLHIREQLPEILQYSNITSIVFDLEQYADSAEEIADTIVKISEAKKARAIIYARGYIPQAKIIMQLYELGIRNFILGKNLSDIRYQYAMCESGWYEEHGNEEITGTAKKPSEELPEKKNTKTARSIGVSGACHRIGTTTQCLQFVKDLMFRGYKACYIQMNQTDYLKEYQTGWFTCDELDEELGRIRIEGIDHFYKVDKLSQVLKQGYDFYIYDFGAYKDNSFNKVSFLEKDVRVFVVGSKPQEFSATRELIDNMFYTECNYIFNLTPENERDELLELMEDKSDQTYFSGIAMDKYVLCAERKIYEEIIPAESKCKIERTRKKKKGLFSFGGKRRESHA